jgi:hypothetical protein
MTMHPDPYHPVNPSRPLPVAPPEPTAFCPGSFALGVCLGLVVGLAIGVLAMLRLL